MLPGGFIQATGCDVSSGHPSVDIINAAMDAFAEGDFSSCTHSTTQSSTMTSTKTSTASELFARMDCFSFGNQDYLGVPLAPDCNFQKGVLNELLEGCTSISAADVDCQDTAQFTVFTSNSCEVMASGMNELIGFVTAALVNSTGHSGKIEGDIKCTIDGMFVSKECSTIVEHLRTAFDGYGVVDDSFKTCTLTTPTTSATSSPTTSPTTSTTVTTTQTTTPTRGRLQCATLSGDEYISVSAEDGTCGSQAKALEQIMAACGTTASKIHLGCKEQAAFVGLTDGGTTDASCKESTGLLNDQIMQEYTVSSIEGVCFSLVL